ncbi:MAG TPA: acyl-CoA dehydrogenase family protein [Polyangiales bacterium]|nr:acyl-CoA dehydrogenase family protein [Polyangiales bacterium]
MSERYHPSPDQAALAASLAESLASILPLSRLRASRDSCGSRASHEESAQTWQALRDLDVFAISLPEDQGGSGLGMAEEALIAIELGRGVVAPSVLATIGAGHMRSGGRAHVPGEGRVAAGYRRGGRVVFVDDAGASELLIRSPDGAELFARPSSSRLIDEQLWSSRLLEPVELGAALVAADPARALRLRLIDSAALAGLAQAALEMAVGYAGLREQFGRPIGSFQAVKHHCANMALSARLACDQVSFAAVALDDGRDDARLQVESAFFVAGSAAVENASKNIQIHGGVGFSDEADPHRLLKRARLLLEIAGGLEAALTRLGEVPTSAELGAHRPDGRAHQPAGG